MFSLRGIVFIASVVSSLLLSRGHCQTPTNPVARQTIWVPDQVTQSLAGRIRADQIASFRFSTGLGSVWFPGLLDPDSNTGAVVVSEPHAVARLLQGLQSATIDRLDLEPHGFTGVEFIDTIEIRFKPVRETHPSPWVFNQNLTTPAWCFGPEFYRAVRSLSDSQADQARRFVSTHAKQIKSVDVDELSVTKPTEVIALVHDLEHLSSQAFVLGPDSNPSSLVTLHMQNGKEESLLLQWQPPSSQSPAPALPPTLWEYYTKGLAHLVGKNR